MQEPILITLQELCAVVASHSHHCSQNFSRPHIHITVPQPNFISWHDIHGTWFQGVKVSLHFCRCNLIYYNTLQQASNSNHILHELSQIIYLLDRLVPCASDSPPGPSDGQQWALDSLGLWCNLLPSEHWGVLSKARRYSCQGTFSTLVCIFCVEELHKSIQLSWLMSANFYITKSKKINYQWQQRLKDMRKNIWERKHKCPLSNLKTSHTFSLKLHKYFSWS